MSLTRKLLTAMGIEAEKVDEIIQAHMETVDGLKGELEEAQKARDQYKKDADKLPKVQKELDEIKKEDGNNAYQVKYDALKEDYDKLKGEFDTYKSDIQAKETKATKEKAYRSMLKEIGVAEKRIDAVLKVTNLDEIELDEKGAVKGEAKEAAKTEWSDFIVTEGSQGASTATPPANNGGESKKTGIAAKIAAEYHDSLYGKVQKEEK